MTKMQTHAALVCALFGAGAHWTSAQEPAKDAAQGERQRAVAELTERWNVRLTWEQIQPRVHEVVAVHISGRYFTDDDLVPIGKLTWVRSISIGKSNIKGPGLAHLRGLERLRRLDLGAPTLAGGLKYLKDLQQLERVDINRMPVTDEDMKHVGQLSNLRELTLIYNGITDMGLAQLKGLSKLQMLGMVEKEITDKGIKHLEALTTLENLGLSRSSITDAGLASLAKLPHLKILSLQDVTGVTDAGVGHLVVLKGVDRLYLDGTSLTDKGVRELAAKTNLYQLFVPDRISDEAFEVVKKSMREPRNAMRLQSRR